MLSESSQTVSVYGFESSLGHVRDIPVCSIAVSYDDPVLFQTFVLVFHQVLYIPGLENHLLNPSQLRHNGLTVNSTPLRELDIQDRTHHSHSILAPYDDNLLHIPLRLQGVMSYFPVRKPTQSEIDDPFRFPPIEMTSSATWEPYNEAISAEEDRLRSLLDVPLVNAAHRIIDSVISERGFSGFCHSSSRFLARVHCSSTQSSRRKGTVSAELLAHRCFVGIDTAQRTIDNTTQLAVRDFSHSTGTKRLKHTAYQLNYRRLRADCYTDTLFAEVSSLKKNTCAQCYCTDFGWTAVYPMQSKSQAHETLDELHRDVGVFNAMIPDNALELTKGEFAKKLRKVNTALKPIEPYTSNHNDWS